MYTLLIVFFLVGPTGESGVAVHSKELPGFADHSTCKVEAEKLTRDLSGNINNKRLREDYPSVVAVRTSCVKIK